MDLTSLWLSFEHLRPYNAFCWVRVISRPVLFLVWLVTVVELWYPSLGFEHIIWSVCLSLECDVVAFCVLFIYLIVIVVAFRAVFHVFWHHHEVRSWCHFIQFNIIIETFTIACYISNFPIILIFNISGLMRIFNFFANWPFDLIPPCHSFKLFEPFWVHFYTIWKFLGILCYLLTLILILWKMRNWSIEIIHSDIPNWINL